MNYSVKKIALVAGVGVLMIGLIGMASKRQLERKVNDMAISIKDQGGNYFIDQFEVTSLINAENTDYVLGLTLDQLNLKELERRVEMNAFVRDAQIYLDIQGNLQVALIQ
ncbi:MAG: cell division protein FtsQ, partial [Cyclobacteriaceae bacterium]